MVNQVAHAVRLTCQAGLLRPHRFSSTQPLVGVQMLRVEQAGRVGLTGDILLNSQKKCCRLHFRGAELHIVCTSFPVTAGTLSCYRSVTAQPRMHGQKSSRLAASSAASLSVIQEVHENFYRCSEDAITNWTWQSFERQCVTLKVNSAFLHCLCLLQRMFHREFCLLVLCLELRRDWR